MFEQLCTRIQAFLAEGHLGVLSAAGPKGVLSLPVRYRVSGVELDCALPRWSDLAFLIEEEPDVTLLLVASAPDGFRWLHYRGQATPIDGVDWTGLDPVHPKGVRPAELYQFLHLRPTRIELISGPPGRAGRETLDFS